MRIGNTTSKLMSGWAWGMAAALLQPAAAHAFVYQGQIKLDGQPLTGTADMLFTLWDDEAAGSMIGDPHLATNVNVVNGLFSIEVDLGSFAQALFDGADRWLETRVRSPAGSGTFTTLEPRQKLSATPYALYARRSDVVNGIDGHSLDGVDSGPVDALYVNDQGHVGIGTQQPSTLLALSVSGATPVGITQNQVAGGASMELTTADGNDAQATRLLMRGSVDNPDIEFYRGARGTEQLTVMIDGATGHLGIGVTDPQTPLALNSTGGNPVGITQNQVAGTSSMELTTSDGAGNQATRMLLRGNGDDGDVEFYRGERGAELQTMIIEGATGHVGIGTSSPAYPLHVSTAGDRAIHGAVTNTSGMSNAIFGHNLSDEGRGVFGYASAETGHTFGGSFQADSTNGTGVRGFAGAAYGETRGVYGVADSPTGCGVVGEATHPTGHADGVYGKSLRGHGVHGVGENMGGFFETTAPPGTVSFGMVAEVQNGTAVSGYARNASGHSTGVYGSADSSTGTGVEGFGGADGYGVFSVGDIGATGVKFFVQPHPDDASKQIRFVALEGTESGTYFRGSTNLTGGRTVIDAPEAFRLATDRDGLTVQLTPRGPDAGLWVESADVDRVVVRGNGDVAFDYFVNGVRRGFAGVTPIQANRAYMPTVRGVPYGTQYRESHRRLLVENGILNEDLTPNEHTAARLGWTLRDPTPNELARAEAWREAQRQRTETDAVQTRSP